MSKRYGGVKRQLSLPNGVRKPLAGVKIKVLYEIQFYCTFKNHIFFSAHFEDFMPQLSTIRKSKLTITELNCIHFPVLIFKNIIKGDVSSYFY